MIVLMKSLTSLEISHVGSKTRLLGQILENPCVPYRGHIFSPLIMKLGENVCLEKPCVRSRGHIFSPIIMKRDQNVCLDEISDKFENESCWVKN